MNLKELKEILSKIQQSNGKERTKYIDRFQEFVWNSKFIKNEEVHEILSTLAYDLDFYEPDDELRKESTSYYGDERLINEIKSTKEKLEEYE